MTTPPMTDRELEGRLRAWYRAEVGEDETASSTLRSDVVAIPRAPSRSDRRFGASRGLTLLAAAALLLVGGAAAAGAGLLQVPSPVPPQPAPSLAVVPTPSPSGTPSASPTAAPQAGALIAYVRMTDKPSHSAADPNLLMCYTNGPTCPTFRLWIVGSDGSNAHELFSDGVTPQGGVAWSPDGTRLLYPDDGKFYLTDATGSEPQLVDTGCVAPCAGDSDAAFSSDGSKIVFLRNSTDAAGYSGPGAIATMDLASGRIAELSSTAPAGGQHPRWSPDGKQIVFFRYGEKDTGGPIAPVKAAVFVVDADGQNLRQVSPTTVAAQFAGWSPDGSRIVFTSPDGGQANIYAIHPDGTGLVPLTTDGISYGATWTPDGRILFLHGLGAAGSGDAPGFWTMDADGGNATELIPATMAGNEDPAWTQGPVWQPIGGPAILPPPWTPSTATSVGPPPPTPDATPTPALSPGFAWTGSMPVTEGNSSAPFVPSGDTATPLQDGRVLVTLGCSTTVQLYDPVTGTFSPTGSLAETRYGKTATQLLDGRVLITGGYNCADAAHAGTWASAELYDPATGTFSPTGSMSRPREFHTATLLPDGRVLIAGGITGESPVASISVVLASYEGAITAETSSNVLASAELYDPATGTFTRTDSMSSFRDHHTATLLEDGRVLVVGGGGEGYASRTQVELYDPTTGTFSRTGSLKTGRWLHTATLLSDGRVLIAGGRSPKDSTYRTAEVYDPGSGTFSPAGSMKAGRQQHTATLLPDGRVLIAGGYQSDGQHWDVLSSTELYDPGTGTFTPIGSMGDTRMEHAATLLRDGRVLIAGGSGIGNSGSFGLTSAVIYQP